MHAKVVSISDDRLVLRTPDGVAILNVIGTDHVTTVGDVISGELVEGGAIVRNDSNGESLVVFVETLQCAVPPTAGVLDQ